jgi:hypothetical protein
MLNGYVFGNMYRDEEFQFSYGVISQTTPKPFEPPAQVTP